MEPVGAARPGSRSGARAATGAGPHWCRERLIAAAPGRWRDGTGSDQSTTLWMEPSSTGDTRRRGARRIEDGRGGLGHAATLRFPSPLIKPDVRISRIRLSDWFHLAAHGGGRVRCVLPKQWALADAPSNTDRRPSSPRGKASSEASGYAGVFQAHRQSPILGFVQSAPEVRALSSASITRPQRSYGPLRLPSDPPPVRRGGLPAPVETGLPR